MHHRKTEFIAKPNFSFSIIHSAYNQIWIHEKSRQKAQINRISIRSPAYSLITNVYLSKECSEDLK